MVQFQIIPRSQLTLNTTALRENYFQRVKCEKDTTVCCSDHCQCQCSFHYNYELAEIAFDK